MEPQIDVTDKDEPHAEVLGPLRVKIIVNNLCLIIELPSRMLEIRLSSFERAYRVRNRKEIEIDEVFALDKELDLLALIVLK